MVFVPSLSPPAGDKHDTSLHFIYSGSKILVKHTEKSDKIPRRSDLSGLPGKQLHLGTINDLPCYGAHWREDFSIPATLVFKELRHLFGHLDDGLFKAAGFGLQMVNWDQDHQFCSRCGGPVNDQKDERAKKCHPCGRLYYPRISPAIIVGVEKNDSILLARSTRYRNSKLYSVIAGYLEVGETLEECVQREVREEVGIEVKNIRYVDSQPWHYSGSFMIGFTAEYAGGTLKPDGVEIADAGWFSADSLPEVPGWGSIAAQLIQRFVTRNSTK